MFAVVVKFTVKPDRHEEFLPLMIENARMSRKMEPGCKQFDVCVGEDPSSVFLYEIYDSKAAFDLHLQSEHFLTFDKTVANMVASKSVQLFHGVIR
ncbi:putative quinol monooxygenase [Cognatishimia activa]|uniref:putative quinol monooxygenase n=1 Tax=Cognatishimia activa TaxID=1715691 RepID=UPI0022301FE0|nr:putative quinol monooxygenase [Cognatishimia activa]UZD90439.1 antibiotic biosynthesis monooxygenase [Cognatishimia activa]